MTQFNGTPEGRWSAEPQQYNPGHQGATPTATQAFNVPVRRIPWDYVIWGIGLVIFIFWLIIVAANYASQDADDIATQMTVASMQTQDMIAGACWVGSLTGIAWIIYRIVSSLRSGK